MSKPKLIFSHICDHVLISQEGKLSVIGIFKEINGINIPSIHPLMILVFEINLGDKESHRLRIEFKDPDGENIKEPINILDVKVNSNDINYGKILNILNTNFSKRGLYKIIMYIDNKIIGEEKILFRSTKNE
ncbi:MAG: hypothetical protein KAJ39_05735 [Gammaproteobacteria bacterium]|nr:hypothetical protein [Gammaproteobacteria bacterium]